jgi:ribosomal protein S18 acetylase RimI-like enzyme
MRRPNAAIRRARPGDAPALARLRLAFRGEVEPLQEDEGTFLVRCEQWMAERLGGADWRAWVAEAEAALVGTAWLRLVEKLPNPVAEPEWHGYVSSLYVVPEWRGAGVGSALLRACLEECERRMVDAVVLWPTARSRSLYLRHGFAVRDDLLEHRGHRVPS